MIVRFSADDLAAIERLGVLAQTNNARKRNVDLNPFRPSGAAGHADGFRGEWAVADALGLPRCLDASGTPDDGADLIVPDGPRLNVRYRNRADGDLMCPANRPFHGCDGVVLVVRTDDPAAVRIVGGISVRRFHDIARRHDFTHGPTDYVAQADLTPWATLAERWSVHA